MKVLFLSQGHVIADHPGWHDALVQLKKQDQIQDFLNIPYFGYAKEHGWDSFYTKVVELCSLEKFDLVYFHYFHKKGKPLPSICIKKLRLLKDSPIIITSCGDGFADNWMRPGYPNDFKNISKEADITFSTQMGKAADKMIKWGARNVVLTPNSMCQIRFKANTIDFSKHDFDFDVVFIGSNNGGRRFNPINRDWWASKEREKLVNKLYERYGMRFGLFGNGWDLPCAQGPVSFDEQQKTFRRGRVIVGGNPYSYSDYYSSNRLFFEISSGVPTLELSVPHLDSVLRNNEHCYFEDSIDKLIAKCDVLLAENPEKIYEKSARAANFIDEKHTQYHRMKFKIDTVKRFIKNNHKLDVDFPFFLPEVDLDTEKTYAIKQS